MKTTSVVPAKKPARRTRAAGSNGNGNGAAVAVRTQEVGDGSGDRVALLAAWVMRFYPLDGATLAQVQADLRARREATA